VEEDKQARTGVTLDHPQSLHKARRSLSARAVRHAGLRREKASFECGAIEGDLCDRENHRIQLFTPTAEHLGGQRDTSGPDAAIE
jgi:hypothetical protein